MTTSTARRRPGADRPGAKRPTAARWIVVALAIGLLAGCGVPTDREARPVEPPPPYAGLGRSATPEPPTPTPPPKVAFDFTVYFLLEGALKPVVRTESVEPDLPTVMRALLLGPSQEEQDAGLTSALLGTNFSDQVRLNGNTAEVDLPVAPDPEGLRSDEAKGYAQIVCTLLARKGVEGVDFFWEGVSTGVPIENLQVKVGPLVGEDYSCPPPPR